MTKKMSAIGHYKSSSGTVTTAGMSGFSGGGSSEREQNASGTSSQLKMQQDMCGGGKGPFKEQSHHHHSHHSHHNHHHPQQHRQQLTSKPRDKHTVHWFRKGLRLHDNPALREGLRGATTFRCVFIIDPWFAGSSNVGINKWRFLLQCLDDLDRNLRKLNSRLFVIRGQPADALPKLFKEWDTTCLTFEEDPEPFGRVRDHNISEMCKELGIEVISAASHTLYNLERIIEKNGGRAPLTYHQFQAIIASMDAPPPPETTITLEVIGNATTPQYDDHDDKYGVPTLEELGFETEALRPPVWIGGETEALARLERHLERKAWVASFGRPKMTPQSLLASQTGLSPYLRFGCLSTRLFYYQLTDLYKKIKKACPPLSLHGQLLWREFFYCAATKNPTFDKMAGNPICVQIPWDRNAEALAKWASGQTGFPWIDAIMTQLREEGWIHHLARHAVACFLTRGDLWISWEEGMKVFEELLLDADWSVNAGMWMWLSCSSFFQQFFHCYCPVKFGRKADPNGDYIRRYLPVLKNFPTRFIHEPWNASESVQRAAKCLVGKDYPLPMVNHAIASRANMERIKQVYQHLAKYRTPTGPTCYESAEGAERGGSAIAGVMTAAKVHHMNTSSMNDSPSPTTILTSVNSSGNYMCRSNPSAQSDPNVKVLNYLPSHGDPSPGGGGDGRTKQGGNTVEGGTGGAGGSADEKRVSDGMENHNHLAHSMQSNVLQHQQQRQQHRHQQQQQQEQQQHELQAQRMQENARPHQTSEHRFGEPSVAEYAAIKPDSLSSLIRAGSLGNATGRYSNLQDQLSNSLMSLECDVMAAKLKPNNYEYERNHNMYNNQFKVEYSDNFNSGYGLRNAVFYGGKREDEGGEEQNGDTVTDSVNNNNNNNNNINSTEGRNIDAEQEQGQARAESLGTRLMALTAVSALQDPTTEHTSARTQIKQEPPVQTQADKSYHRQRQEALQRQQQPETRSQSQSTPVKNEQRTPQLLPSPAMHTDCDYEPERHNLLADIQRPQHLQRKPMMQSQVEPTLMEQGNDQPMSEAPASDDKRGAAD
ncbi:cryptochrome-1-like [Anopheles ziemanni]|uniref:cryptochrome-1-like n=1 Tax=Anopheles coustani TaxID=139045 RepID=UPI002657D4C2|nr:cryptochrome-1-like [Anopheles coustani]XP_058169537.1 cryptochrome-1-like [Anopheles ziemanni]